MIRRWLERRRLTRDLWFARDLARFAALSLKRGIERDSSGYPVVRILCEALNLERMVEKKLHGA